jgi:hypothetical protein
MTKTKEFTSSSSDMETSMWEETRHGTKSLEMKKDKSRSVELTLGTDLEAAAPATIATSTCSIADADTKKSTAIE